MADITMSLDDTLELDAVIKEWSDPDTVITDSDNKFNISGFHTSTGVLNPTEAGEHTIKVNGQELIVKVTDPNTIPDSGVLHLTFDDNDTNGDTAVDIWGSNNGIISGTKTGVEGKLNQAYDFDGVDDNVIISEGTGVGDTPFSISIWIKTSQTPSNNTGIFERDDGSFSTGTYQMILDVNGPSPTGNIRVNAPNINGLFSSIAVNDGSFHHLVATFGNSENKLYIDGSLDVKKTDSSIPKESSFDLGFGGTNQDNYKGILDDPRIYDKELLSKEVSNLYDKGYING